MKVFLLKDLKGVGKLFEMAQSAGKMISPEQVWT